MYPLPKCDELKFLVGLKISEVKMFDYTVIIKFENSPIEINGWRECLFTKRDHTQKRNAFDERGNLTNHKIEQIYIENEELYLNLDNDFEIILSGKDKKYECFTISADQTTFVV